MKRKIEIFTAGCPLCDPVVQMVNEQACENCEVIIYDMATQCENKTCLEKAKAYGVVTIPAVAVDGRLLSCCENKGVTKEALIEAGVGKT